MTTPKILMLIGLGLFVLGFILYIAPICSAGLVGYPAISALKKKTASSSFPLPQ
jgi:hypothetical protein